MGYGSLLCIIMPAIRSHLRRWWLQAFSTFRVRIRTWGDLYDWTGHYLFTIVLLCLVLVSRR